MNLQRILLIVVVLIIIYLVYYYFFRKTDDKTLVSKHDAKVLQVIDANTLPVGASTSSDYTFSIWFYINDWNYRFGETKVIYGRVDTNNEPSPSVTLGASTNDLNVTVATYPTTGQSSKAILHSCSVQDIPIQRWTNLIVTLNNRAMDIYLDGKLVKTCLLPGVPKINPNANVLMCPNGGFSGYISQFRYLARAVNPSQAYDIYKQGVGSGNPLGNLFNKYGVRVSIVKDNQEVNTIQF